MTHSVTNSRTGRPCRALVLTGGGARAAYQVGVIKAVAELVPKGAPLPFRVLCGTSAGAIVGSVLAAHADDFHAGAVIIERFWSHFRVGQVWRNDLRSVAKAALRWFGALCTGGALVRPPHSLFDNAPLRITLESHVNFARIQHSLHRGDLDALAVIASPYHGARSRAYYMSRDDQGVHPDRWQGGVPTHLTIDHLMASAAVPFLFPAVHLEDGFYGDGAMRQIEPLAPAINLGADRVLIVGVRPGQHSAQATMAAPLMEPSFGQIFGFMLDTLFMSSMREDLDRIERDNRLLAVTGTLSSEIRPIQAMLIEPSEDPGDVVAAHAPFMPFAVRMLMRFLGAANRGGRLLLSYLLFEGAYAQKLIELGYRDAMARRDELQSFLSNEE